jgi:MFS family permease
MGAQCFPAIMLLLIMFFMPESPRWLANKGRDTEALEIIAKLRGEGSGDEGSIQEYATITKSIAVEKCLGNGDWSELLVPGIINRLIIAMTLQMCQQLTGINVILYYQGDLLKGMGVNPKDAAIQFTLANDFVNFIATFPGMYLIDRVGRRKLLLCGGIGIAVSHLMVCFFVGNSQGSNHAFYSWGAILSIYMFLFSFAAVFYHLISDLGVTQL